MLEMNSNTTRKNLQGGAKVPAVGSKAEVWHGSAKHTSGGLTKRDLMKTRKGRIVSRKKHALGKKAVKVLQKLGYKPKKGQFKLFTKKSKRGGSTSGFSASGFDGELKGGSKSGFEGQLKGGSKSGFEGQLKGGSKSGFEGQLKGGSKSGFSASMKGGSKSGFEGDLKA